MVIDQRFGRGAIIQEALNEALPRFYGEAVAENSLNPLAQPEVEVTKLEDGDSIEFTAEVDVRPDFDLPDFSTLTATVDAIEVTDEQIDAQLTGLRQRFGSKSVVERPAATGDLVTIDLVATKDGEQLPDATADGLEYEIGTSGMLDGLDEAVTGLSAGESAEFASTLVGVRRRVRRRTSRHRDPGAGAGAARARRRVRPDRFRVRHAWTSCATTSPRGWRTPGGSTRRPGLATRCWRTCSPSSRSSCRRT